MALNKLVGAGLLRAFSFEAFMVYGELFWHRLACFK